MSFEFLTYRIEDFVAVLTINRSPVNALNRGLVSELGEAAERIERDVDSNKVRAIIITAEGKYFCAGADLKERMDMTEEEVEPTVRNIGQCVNKIAEISVPTIAAMQGSAMGGGFEVALAADIRILVDSAQVGLRETALAIIPGAGGTQRLTRLIGPSNAILWITTAGLFSAEEAHAQGAVNYVVSAAELMPKAQAVAKEISKNGPLAVRQAKKAVKNGLGKSIEEGLDLEFDCYQKIISTQDRIEGLQAFKEKRQPRYEGK
ncbi:enoyl-CoA hydratase [candidate division KSB1 bacterium]|nr:enoyl-CoA hydratase [candidate division KSB1 bacterium]NIR72429.1 enoyl-CoA hydratase [candidate division KSB1 bacterium]NIS23594.1 enoyl-CoA hydratase [candidate division KSB1 bacterium]NIT70520.1 enoyl-CoA hydratase [candidate division KSB1 bacterium]NIU24228.1 enoyl-CoA hydratase [candidate division KSB1 bacterium]